MIKQFRQNTTFYIHFYIYHGADPFQNQMQIYRSRLVSKYLVPQQNFINLLQEKLPSSLTGISENEQVSFERIPIEQRTKLKYYFLEKICQ